MSSDRTSASAMDADAAPAPPSPPRSRKRPSRMADGHSSPNPSPRGSPKRRLRTSAESAALALAAVAASASAVSVRDDEGHNAVQRRGPVGGRVDGGHGAIHMLGAAAARVDGGHAAIQMPGRAGTRVERRHAAARRLAPAGVGVGHGAVQKHWSDADEFTLLAAAVAFRQRTGRAPCLPDMGALFDSIRGSISPHINQDLVYYKLKRFKSKFQHSDGPRDRRLRDLCAKAWGGVPPSEDNSDGQEAGETDADELRAVPDAAAMMPVVTEVLGEYWKTNERAMAGVPLEKGLSRLGKRQGRMIETKWRQQLDEEMKTQMRRHDLGKEVCALLNDAIKGLGP
uniref:Glabrous enhancer-binding protein-like DBD domain-containing protein n=1 Tax=Arundo donax TaxID=35708 RepID=A0A0A8YJH9_ARUDO